MHAVSDLVSSARRAAAHAAHYLRTIDRATIAREYKTDAHDIVTVHDRETERIIVDQLVRDHPEATIIGEESGTHAGGKHSDLRFYVDPIDGTSNFAAGLPTYCVSIGVAIGTELVGGVVNAPLLDQEFWSDTTGAYLGDLRLGGYPTRDEHDALVLTAFPTAQDYAEFPDLARTSHEEMVRHLGAVRSLGTAALELAYVAAGWADATMLARINPWDVAAGFHLVLTAGGSVRTWNDPSTGHSTGRGRLEEAPAYVACRGPERLALLDDIEDAVCSHRKACGCDR